MVQDEAEPQMENHLDNGIRCEIKALDERVQKNGELKTVEKPDLFSDIDAGFKVPFSEYALVSTRTFDIKQKLTSTNLRINSKPLLRALKEVVKYYPSNPEHFDASFDIESPFEMLYHHKEALVEFQESTEDDDAKMHVNLLLNYLKIELGESMVQAEKLQEAGFITFPLLWTIFKPGELFYQSLHGHPRLYRLERTNYDENNMGKYLSIHLIHTDHDGKDIGRVKVKHRIYQKVEFGGPVEVVSLSVFPLKYFRGADQEKVKLSLVERGKMFFKFVGPKTVRYNGLFLRLKSPPYDYYDSEANISDYDGVWLPHTSTGRMVLDCKTFAEDHDLQREVVQRKEHQHVSFLPSCAIPEDQHDDPMLCPPFVYGYSLSLKTWCRLFVTCIEEIEWDPKAFDSLVLQPRYKAVIKGLVNSHIFPNQSRDETVLKGKGLVMLLHGTAGSGKTMTAETVAEHTKRPLLIISSGELGSWEARVEYELKSIFNYATIWGAVILIDEADVFLEERSSTSDKMDRNGLVAIFLRQLEYFQGILFMTSNRVEVFDQALKSRIHLALQYCPPTENIRVQLWKRTLSLVPTEEIAVSLEEVISAVGTVEMNGREISNTVTTARTLARDLNEKLALEHVRTIIEVWSDFQNSTAKKPTITCACTTGSSQNEGSNV